MGAQSGSMRLAREGGGEASDGRWSQGAPDRDGGGGEGGEPHGDEEEHGSGVCEERERTGG